MSEEIKTLQDEISVLKQESGRMRLMLIELVEPKNWARARHMNGKLCWINNWITPNKIYKQGMAYIYQIKPSSYYLEEKEEVE